MHGGGHHSLKIGMATDVLPTWVDNRVGRKRRETSSLEPLIYVCTIRFIRVPGWTSSLKATADPTIIDGFPLLI